MFLTPPRNLLLEYLFDVANLFLNLSANFLVRSFSFQVRVLGGARDLLINRSLQFVRLARNFVFRAVFHNVLLAKREARGWPKVKDFFVSPFRMRSCTGLLISAIRVTQNNLINHCRDTVNVAH